MKWRPAIAVALAAAGTALLLTPAGGALGTLAQRSLADEPAAGPAEAAPAIPSLSEADKTAALDIVSRDRRVERLLGGRAYSVKAIGPWTTFRRHKLGASLVLQLPEPTSFATTDLPEIDYDEGEATATPYRQTTVPLGARNVHELMVRVDLSRGRLVSVEPGVGGDVVPGTGVTRVYGTRSR